MSIAVAKQSPDDFKKKSEQACDAASEFVKIYYDAIDKKRHILDRLYHDSATLLWNGNSVTGQAAISQYLNKLPSSEHKVETLDAQSMPDHATQGQIGILVLTAGIVKYKGHSVRNFSQNFMLTAQNNTWKVVTDCFRTNE